MLLLCRVVRGTFSGEETQANMAMWSKRRSDTVRLKNTRAGTLSMAMSAPTARHWACSTCWTSSRLRLPAVVIRVKASGVPSGRWRMPPRISVNPAASNAAAAASGAYGYWGTSSVKTQSSGETLVTATGCSPRNSWVTSVSRSRA